jgi:hypothetical protein
VTNYIKFEEQHVAALRSDYIKREEQHAVAMHSDYLD